MMIKAVVLVALVVVGACLSTITYPFFQNQYGTDMLPYIELKGLTANDVLTFDILFFKDTGFGPSIFHLVMLNASASTMSPQPTGFGTTNDRNIVFNSTITDSWTVPFSGDYIL